MARPASRTVRPTPGSRPSGATHRRGTERARRHREPVARERDRRLDQPLPRQRPVLGPGQVQPGHCAGTPTARWLLWWLTRSYSPSFMNIVGSDRAGAVSLKSLRHRVTFGRPVYQKPTATDVACRRVGHRQRGWAAAMTATVADCTPASKAGRVRGRPWRRPAGHTRRGRPRNTFCVDEIPTAYGSRTGATWLETGRYRRTPHLPARPSR